MSSSTSRPSTSRHASSSSRIPSLSSIASSSSNSGNSLNMRRVPAWQPSEPVALTGEIDGRKSGKGRVLGGGKEVSGEAERGLSSLYVTSERERTAAAAAAAATSAATLAAAEAKTEEKNKKRTWGGALVNGAMTATVFSAALGLTAYRLWSHRGESAQIEDNGEETPTLAELSPDELDQKEEAEDVTTPTLPTPAVTPPPPAYEETAPRTKDLIPATQRNLVENSRDVEEAWEELDNDDDEQLITPSTSTASTLRRPPRHFRHSSTTIASRRVKLPPRLNTQRSAIAKNPIQVDQEEPEGVIDDDDDPHIVRTNAENVPEQSRLPEQVKQSLETEDDEELDLMVERLDLMSVRLRGLIEQGQKALAVGHAEDAVVPEIPDAEAMAKEWKMLEEVKEDMGDGEGNDEIFQDEGGISEIGRAISSLVAFDGGDRLVAAKDSPVEVAGAEEDDEDTTLPTPAESPAEQSRELGGMEVLMDVARPSSPQEAEAPDPSPIQQPTSNQLPKMAPISTVPITPISPQHPPPTPAITPDKHHHVSPSRKLPSSAPMTPATPPTPSTPTFQSKIPRPIRLTSSISSIGSFSSVSGFGGSAISTIRSHEKSLSSSSNGSLGAGSVFVNGMGEGRASTPGSGTRIPVKKRSAV